MAFRIKKKNSEKVHKDIENGRLLVEATENDDVETMRTLLESGSSVNADEYNRTLFYKSRNYLTPLQIAAQKGHSGPVRLLIEYDAEIDACDRYDITPLHMAAEGGFYECLKLLLDAGANCNIATKYARYTSHPVPYPGATTALHVATKNKHSNCVRELILNGADYNATNQYGHTSLYIASMQGSEDIVLTHLRNAVGRDILSLPIKESSDTPLHECVRLGMSTAVVELLKHGSDPNHRNTSGYSPLHLACHNTENYNFDIVRDIVRFGYNTDINHQNTEPFATCTSTSHINYTTGATPLHYSSFKDSPLYERRPGLAAFLIAYGANFEACKNRHGHTLLAAELRSTSDDDTILRAITDALPVLPNLESMGIYYSPQLKRVNPVPAIKYKWYMNLRENPRSLQHYCRCAVREVLGVSRIRKIVDLPLPTTLKEYLLLEFDELR